MVILTRVNRVSPSSSAVFPKLAMRSSSEKLRKKMITSALHVAELVVKATIFVEAITTEA
jgi:hypothetical protein